ncbi:MAG: DUF1700 domain-containing protein [Acholeplasmataceae bacterium]|nr:DUF1700 domain-containing protein [Acholeplasmataceae bacterium]
MKNKYLKELTAYFERKLVSKTEIKEIVNDYSYLYDEALESGLAEAQIVEKLGTPQEIYYSLQDDLNKMKKTDNKIVALMTFFAMILFFIFGMALNLWTYSWLFFLLIPITALLTEKVSLHRLPGLAVFISSAIFYVVGMEFDLWHPMWLVFLSIPILGVIVSDLGNKIFVGLTPFVSTIIYFLVSYFWPDFYIYGWPVFLLIPLIGSLYIDDKIRKTILFLSILVAIVLYYILSISTGNWALPMLIFILPFAYSIYAEQIQMKSKILKNKYFGIIAILILVTYFVVSLFTKGWAWSWMILLLVPIIAIYFDTKFEKIVDYTPFIATILFYSTGYFVEGAWTYSWLFFVIIPIAGILFPKEEKEKIEDY